MGAIAQVNPRWVQIAMDRCQTAATGAPEPSCASAGRAFLARMPSPRSRVEALILRGLLAEVMLRTGVALGRLPPDCVSLLTTLARAAYGQVGLDGRPPIHPKVRRAIAAMKRGYMNPDLSLCELACRVGLTSSHLSRLLHKETTLGFVGHLRGIRLRKATALMRSDRVSIKEVAASVGYKYSGDFARDFKSRYGVTPSVWRRRIKQLPLW